VLLLLAGITFLLLRLAAVLSGGRRSEDRAVALAALGAVASVTLHESLDFGLTLPGNALTLAALLGRCWSPAPSTRTPRRRTGLKRAGNDGPGSTLRATGGFQLQHVEPAGDRQAQIEDGSLIPFPGRRRPGDREAATTVPSSRSSITAPAGGMSSRVRLNPGRRCRSPSRGGRAAVAGEPVGGRPGGGRMVRSWAASSREVVCSPRGQVDGGAEIGQRCATTNGCRRAPLAGRRCRAAGGLARLSTR